MTTFLFYDIETTGLNPAFDQILTFAAIRTDTNLNEMERYSITINLRPDIVPSPSAFITHKLMVEELSQGICEYEAALKINEIMNKPRTVSIGYNSLGFDDEFLRFTFYRNLLEPYTHQYANGCYRADLLPITTLYRVFKPEIIKWPTDREGEQHSLKLELISKANQFTTSGKAHNAMADVEATVALAKSLIREKAIWSYCLSLFDKNSERVRIDKILLQPNYKQQSCAIIVSHKIGSKLMYLAPVIGIGRSNHYANQSLWIRLDKEIIPNTNGSDSNSLNSNSNFNDLLKQTIPINEEASTFPFAIRKKDGETGIILPKYQRYWNRLSEEQRTFADKNIEIINASIENHAIFSKIVEYHRQFKYPFVPEADLDSVLYQSDFFSKTEKQEMDKFHRYSLMEKVTMVEEMKLSRVKSLAIRIIFRNYLQKVYWDNTKSLGLIDSVLITREHRRYMERVVCSSNDSNFNTKRIIGFKGDERLIPEKATDELNDIIKNQPLDDEQKKVLKWLEGYLTRFSQKYSL